MRIVFFGTPDYAVPSLAALLDAGHDVACVVTQPDRPCGRHRKLAPPPAKEFALARGLPVRQTDDVNAPVFVADLRALAPELIAVAAFGQMLRRGLLGLPCHGCINVHASLLPRHRGAAPVAYAILSGDAETGVTIMQMVRTMDAGDILAQEATAIGPHETTGDLTQRLAHLGACLLVKAVAQIAAGKARPEHQDRDRATFAPSLDKRFGVIVWSRPADFLARFVRAMNPWPGAFTFWMPSDALPLRVVIHEAEAVPGEAPAPGRIASIEPDGFAVGAGDGLLRVHRIQAAGGRPMSAIDFARGHRLAVGQLFGDIPSPI